MVLEKYEIKDLQCSGKEETKAYSKQSKIYLFIYFASGKRHNLKCFNLMALFKENRQQRIVLIVSFKRNNTTALKIACRELGKKTSSGINLDTANSI